ncbi:carboxylating nicotinate-nucleotide diphosphorylase [Arthrobacter wenxiniae]|uniref:Nicotinate-nucleotide pyrophosphorylase [carboxylating] n=1 Tax=Arthrobacter wenxiniae TaxID=2713570 RepID=A0A7Y7IEG6_9MICC|nr:carboxylating nicotinate-nucleotide diphosphorylase [Arthrobacter wenxiniae]NVM93993.1 carboxylating nicotinate-nucleotide diphosphorylase [Arthrobacter wenxiniae]
MNAVELAPTTPKPPAAAAPLPPVHPDPAPLPTLPGAIVENILRAAFVEDAPYGDITSATLLPAHATATAWLVAREPGIFSGGDVFTAAMVMQDPAAEVERLVADGQPFATGQRIMGVTGLARAVLTAERIALNLTQRMSAIATQTAEYARQIEGTGARVTDTRKTTPGLRALERYAVRCGGGHNHRFSLSDAVLAKDNHLAVLTGGDPARLTAALAGVRAQLPHTVHFEVEVDSIEQIEPVLAAGVDTIMLDNFTLDQLVEGVALVNGRALVEASGNVNLATIAGIARTGVDIISVGALTHSVRALDLGLDIAIEAAGSRQ